MKLTRSSTEKHTNIEKQTAVEDAIQHAVLCLKEISIQALRGRMGPPRPRYGELDIAAWRRAARTIALAQKEGLVSPDELKFAEHILRNVPDIYRHLIEDPPRKQGPDQRRYLIRNAVIVELIADLKFLYGIDPHKNPATPSRESGCSIIVEALAKIGVHLSEKAVEQIWRKRPKNYGK